MATVHSSSADRLERDVCPIPLHCPECRHAVAFEVAPGWPGATGAFGVLSCPCARYPVLDGIPVLRAGRADVQDHMTGHAEVDGPSVAGLVDLVLAGRGVDALVEMLAFPPPVPLGLGGSPGLRLPFTRGPWPRAALAARRGEVRGLLDEIDGSTAQDWMELCYARSSERINAELLPYFFLRFGQPRLLASMALLRALPAGPGPILDLACGFGHVMYHLAVRERPVDSVGLDRNFFQLWVARRFVAPTQSFVCADRVDSLPFPDDAFRASVCTDAFHLFDVQQEAMDELRRVAVADTVVLDRVGNVRLEPHDTAGERDPAGYVALVRGAPYRLIDEQELLTGYLDGHGPRLAEARPPAAFDDGKWLGLLTTTAEDLFVDDGPFDGWPHAAGTLRINPVYAVTDERDGASDVVHLSFAFPSTWYAFENAGMLAYTSPGERYDRATFEALAAGRPTAETARAVRRFVVLGIPPRYARPPGEESAAGSVTVGLLRGARRRLLGIPSPRVGS